MRPTEAFAIAVPVLCTSLLLLVAAALHAARFDDAARVLFASLVLGAGVLVVGPSCSGRVASVPLETRRSVAALAFSAGGCVVLAWRAGRIFSHPLATWWAVAACAVTTCWLVGLYAWPAP